MSEQFQLAARAVSAVLALLIAWTPSAAASPADRQPGRGVAAVALQLPWQPGFQFAGYYMAIEKGYYRSAGFDVEVRHGDGSRDSVDEVVQGRAQYGVAGSRIIFRYLQGAPVVLLASVFQHSPDILVVPARTGIRSLKGLVGRRLMIRPSGVGVAALQMLMTEGVTLDDVVFVARDPTLRSLADGRADGCFGYSVTLSYDLAKLGVPHVVFRPNDHGVDFYGDSIFTTRARVEAEPERVRAFRDASLKGWDDAVALPAEAIDLILAKYASGESRDRLEFQAREVRRLVDAELVAIGHMNPHRWAKAIPEPVEPESQARGVGLPEDLLFDGADAEPSRRWMRVLLRAVACLTAILPALLFGVVALRVAVRRRTAELARTNRRLELEMRERHAVEELVRVQRDAAVVLGGMSTLETSLEPLLDILLRLPDADSVGLYLVQEASGAVDLAAHRGVGEAFARHFSRGSAGSHVERVVSAGKTICVDSDEISRAADVETLREGVKSFALVPMLHEGRVVAVIALGSHHAKAVSPGSVLAMESVAQNFGSILSRLRAAAAVLESERNFRQVSECAYDGVAIVDPTGETLYVNSNLVKMLGATLADVGSKRFIDFIPAPSRVEVAQRLRDRAAGRPVSEHFETALRRLDGAEIPVDVTARRTEWKGRPALSYSFRDMSEKKRLEREVLSVAEWEKRRIAHDLHDGLGQRLTGIGYLLDALIASLEGVSPVQAAAATKIRANCTTAHQELRHIVRGVLPVRDDETLQDCLARSAGDAAEQFGIACVFSDQLGGAAPTHAAKANLYHIVQEAVTNAVRHGGARRVEITLRPEAGGWALTVEDDGRGFDTDASSTNGSGMRIMHYRADLAGGTLTFGRAALGGVCVRCAFAPGGVADRPTRTGGGR